jgi:hypothetical protein
MTIDKDGREDYRRNWQDQGCDYKQARIRNRVERRENTEDDSDARPSPENRRN